MRRAGVKNAGGRAKTPGHMTTTVYDEVRYSNYPYAQTHPDRLAKVALLHGPAATPGIRAVGIDLAASAIEEGRAAVAAVGLENVELRQGDVRELTHGEL